MSLATCHRCGRAFEYKPSPHFREEFHYCDKADCEPTERYKRLEERMKEPTVISEAMLAHMAVMPKFRFQFGASGFREAKVDLSATVLEEALKPGAGNGLFNPEPPYEQFMTNERKADLLDTLMESPMTPFVVTGEHYTESPIFKKVLPKV